MLRRVPQPPESGCRKCRGPKKGFLNAKVLMLDFRSRPVYLKTSLTRNGFTQISGTPSKPTLKARGAVTLFLASKVHCFPVFCTKYQATVNSFQIYQLRFTSSQFHDTIVDSCSTVYVSDFSTPAAAMSAICWYYTSNPQIWAPLTKVYTVPDFCKKYQAIVNVFSGTSWDLCILHCIS